MGVFHPQDARLYFLHHRELLGELARLAYETVREMMAAAVEGPHARPGMVAVIQSFGASLKWNPHIHAIVTRGVFLRNGSWQPILSIIITCPGLDSRPGLPSSLCWRA